MPAQSLVTISFNLDQSGAPQWSAVPEIDSIPWGTDTIITWQLVPGSGAPTAQFAPSAGIFFQPSPVYPAQWPNAQPQPVPAGKGQPILQYQVDDPNYNAHSTTDYKYTVNVVVNGRNYPWDPEIENDGGG